MDQDADHSDDERLDQLLSAIGAGDISAAKRVDFERQLHFMRYGFEIRLPDSASADTDNASRQRRRSLQKTLAAITELRQQWQQIDPSTKREITTDGWERLKPDLPPDPDLNETLQYQALIEPKLLERVLEIFDLNIRYHLDKTRATYHQAPLRKLLIEPFIRFLHSEHLLENALPLSRKMKALFDWAGVEQRHRPTNTNIAAIARELKARLKADPAESTHD